MFHVSRLQIWEEVVGVRHSEESRPNVVEDVVGESLRSEPAGGQWEELIIGVQPGNIYHQMWSWQDWDSESVLYLPVQECHGWLEPGEEIIQDGPEERWCWVEGCQQNTWEHLS